MYSFITLVLLIIIASLTVRNRRLHKTRELLIREFDGANFIIENLQDGLLECDANIVVTRVNHAAENILDLNASQIINRSLDPATLANDTDKRLALVLFPPKDGKPSYDILMPPKDTKLRIFTITKTNPITGTVSGYIKIIRDISSESTKEEHPEEPVDEPKNELIPTVSHQMLTPLTGLKWILKSVLGGDAGPLNPKQIDLLTKGLSANDNMINLVNDILGSTKIEQTNFIYNKTLSDIVPVVRDIVLLHKEKAESRRIRLEESIAVPNKEMLFDKERLTIALNNVLDNAIDYSPVGSSVLVSLSVVDTNNVQIKIIDKGIGIDAVDLEKIFTKFYRSEDAKEARESGTGLGLYLAKRIVEDHGGKITVSSKKGEGSMFIINLPIGSGNGTAL